MYQPFVVSILAYQDCLFTPENTPKSVLIPTSGIITSRYFTTVDLWTEDGCLSLLEYYLKYERLNRKGWNNNMSLVNQEGKAGDIVWSLLYWKFANFEKGIAIILPFKLEPDERGILRAAIKLSKIKSKAVFWSQEHQTIVTGEYREALVEGLYWRIVSGFSWLKPGKEGIKHNKNLRHNKVRRYRLVALLNSPNVVLKSDFDVHHLNGVKELLKGNYALAATDDRSFNLEVQHKTEHRLNHNSFGDKHFKDYRKPKQLELKLDI